MTNPYEYDQNQPYEDVLPGHQIQTMNPNQGDDDWFNDNGIPTAPQSPDQRAADVRNYVTSEYTTMFGHPPNEQELAEYADVYTRFGGEAMRGKWRERLAGNGQQNTANAFPGPDLPSMPGAPKPWPPWTGSFEAPTADSVAKDAGFQFRLGEGLKALQRSAASKGNLLTGGVLKNLEQFGQDYSSNEYKNVYDRAYNDYETKRTDFLTNEANRYSSERGNRMDDWGISSGYFDMGRAKRLDDFNIWHNVDQDWWNRMSDLGKIGAPRNPY